MLASSSIGKLERIGLEECSVLRSMLDKSFGLRRLENCACFGKWVDFKRLNFIFSQNGEDVVRLELS
jgi:hypothetical protein